MGKSRLKNSNNTKEDLWQQHYQSWISWKGLEGDKRSTIEVVANQMQILDRAPKNGNGAKATETSKPEEPVDDGDNPFTERGETTDQIPF
jgi:hypothetical protein